MPRCYLEALDEIEFEVEDATSYAPILVSAAGAWPRVTRWTVRGIRIAASCWASLRAASR